VTAILVTARSRPSSTGRLGTKGRVKPRQRGPKVAIDMRYTRVATGMIASTRASRARSICCRRLTRSPAAAGRSAAGVTAGDHVRPALEVADIFRGHGRARKANASDVSLDQLKVTSAIERCRTAELGGHVARCEKCASCAQLRLGCPSGWPRSVSA
jgi:hypothetical protein